MKIDDLYTIEWAYIPHFYSSFYVFQYATSIAAGSLFAEAILEGRAGRARALPQAAGGRQLRLSLRPGEGRGRRSRHAGALRRGGRRA